MAIKLKAKSDSRSPLLQENIMVAFNAVYVWLEGLKALKGSILTQNC